METYDDVKDFMLVCGQKVQHKPKFNAKDKQAILYLNLIKEEVEELIEAFTAEDIVEVADACGDIKWVVEGLEHTLGIPQQEVWDEITASNMSKTVEGKVIKREDGKILKPDTYFPPNIKKVIESKQ